MAGQFYTYQCLRSVMFAAQEVERTEAAALDLGHALMGLARELATPLPPDGAGPPLPTGSPGLPLVEAVGGAALVLDAIGVSPLQLAQATVAVYGGILPEDLSADLAVVPAPPLQAAEMERAATREILGARKAHQNHVGTRDRLLALIVARGHLPSGQLLDILEVRHHRDLEEAARAALEAERQALNELMFLAADADAQLAAEMVTLFPGARGMRRRRARQRRREHP